MIYDVELIERNGEYLYKYQIVIQPNLTTSRRYFLQNLINKIIDAFVITMGGYCSRNASNEILTQLDNNHSTHYTRIDPIESTTRENPINPIF